MPRLLWRGRPTKVVFEPASMSLEVKGICGECGSPTKTIKEFDNIATEVRIALGNRVVARFSGSEEYGGEVGNVYAITYNSKLYRGQEGKIEEEKVCTLHVMPPEVPVVPRCYSNYRKDDVDCWTCTKTIDCEMVTKK